MWKHTLFKSHTSPLTRRRPTRPRPGASRLQIETLEDRCLLSFGLAANYDTSYGPRSADAGDFDGDGHADVASATLLGIAVRLNNGDGTLAGEVLYPLGQDPITTAVGDLNGDGKLDLAATTATLRYVGYFDQDGNFVTGYVLDGHVRIMLGNGDGTFTVAAASYDLGEGGRHTEAVLGDLDADGDLDLAISNLDGAASVLLANGDGSFAAATNPEIGIPTRDVDLADLNGDGRLDLIAAVLLAEIVSALLFAITVTGCSKAQPPINVYVSQPALQGGDSHSTPSTVATPYQEKTDVERLLYRARELQDKGQFQSALGLVDQALQIDENSPSATAMRIRLEEIIKRI
jgi:hypothetical protein